MATITKVARKTGNAYSDGLLLRGYKYVTPPDQLAWWNGLGSKIPEKVNTRHNS